MHLVLKRKEKVRNRVASRFDRFIAYTTLRNYLLIERIVGEVQIEKKSLEHTDPKWLYCRYTLGITTWIGSSFLHLSMIIWGIIIIIVGSVVLPEEPQKIMLLTNETSKKKWDLQKERWIWVPIHPFLSGATLLCNLLVHLLDRVVRTKMMNMVQNFCYQM